MQGGTREREWGRFSFTQNAGNVRAVLRPVVANAPVVTADSTFGGSSAAGDDYRARIVECLGARIRLRADFDRLSNARATTFVGALICIFSGINWPHSAMVAAGLLAVGLGSGAAFVWLLFKHADVHREQTQTEGRRRINEKGLARLERDWSKLPVPPAPASLRDDPVALDLDLFGPGSLFHLVCTAGTPQGRRRLAGVLAPPPGEAPSSDEEIRTRQEAVAELAAAVDLRQELQLIAEEFTHTMTPGGPILSDDDALISWATNEPYLLPRLWLVAATRLLPVLIVLAIVGGLMVDPGWILALVILWIGRYVLTALTGGPLQPRLNSVGAKERNLRGYRDLFSLLAKWQPKSPELRRLAKRFQGADTAMHSLDGLVSLAAIRTTPANPVAQWLFLWDYHALYLMERWQERHGAQVRGWFEALAEVEMLASLATLKFDHPGWPFPTFTSEAKIEARALGHPLLPDGARVANDVTLGPPGTFLLVTGSNMSGKSTLLRTLGINAVLARAGAPVCAAELRLPPVLVLATSLRVQDSLQEGVSFFMAELRRLAWVVERADALADAPGGPVVLYLLDEILRGTNTQERQVIVGKVVAHLLGRPAIGAVSTHDLSLAEMETLAAKAQTVHFREEFEESATGATMRFDYRMRPGLATTTNALKLLKVIGLKL